MGQTTQVQIDSREYSFSKFGAKHGLKILLRLAKIIGKPLALGYAAVGDQRDGTTAFIDRNINGDLLAQAVESLMKNAHEDEVIELCMELSSKTVLCEGKQIDFNSHY